MNQKMTSIVIVCAMLLMGITINIDSGAQGAFVNYQSVPWDSNFTPLDSAWDPAGDNCIVVGNDTSGLQSSAWHYYEPTDTWSQISEAGGYMSTPGNYAENQNSGISYPTIQGAIDAANEGDTIEVWAGSYTENIAVGIPLTLEGNGSYNTVIDGAGAGNVVTISVDGVEFSGFTVTNSGAGNSGILLFNSDNSQIHNNTAEGNGYGIRLEGSSNNIIRDNDVENNDVGMITTDSPEIKKMVGITGYGGMGYGTMFDMDPSGDNYEVVRSFTPAYEDGYSPQFGKLTQDIFDPSILFGMTANGGTYNEGVIYKVRTDGSDYEILHEFNGGTTDGGRPYDATLLQIGSTLYGMTYDGGISDAGVIFSIERDGTGFDILHEFSTGAGGNSPRGSLTYDGIRLYGMTYYGGAVFNYGVIFSMNLDGSAYTVLRSFSAPDGEYPYGSLILDMTTGTSLFGMARVGGSGYGTIFRISTDGSSFNVLHTFTALSTDGRYPYGSLIQDGLTLYGMTYQGGNALGNDGCVFKIQTDGSGFTLLHSFSTSGGGYYPYGDLVQSGGMLYGMTRYATGGTGMIFGVSTDGLTYNTLHTFTNSPDGAYPYGGLILDGATLYGATGNGGLNYGALFKINTDSSGYSIIHNFDGVEHEGTKPSGRMVQDGNTLYGVTEDGGAYGYGTFYKINTDYTGYTILHNFDYNTEGYPYASSVIQVGSTFYGMLYEGNTDDQGSLYKINADGTGFTILRDFEDWDGSYPSGYLAYSDPYLYGMTESGGMWGEGVLYRLRTDGTDFSVMAEFEYGSGSPAYPYFNGLVDGGSVMYGFSQNGGIFSRGCIFSIDKTTWFMDVLYSFTGDVDGSYPHGVPILDGGYLYGTASSDGDVVANDGTIFRINTDGTNFVVLHTFLPVDGSNPYQGLALDGNELYGMTGNGGAFNDGTIFKMDKDTTTFTVLHEFSSNPDGRNPNYNDITVVVIPAAQSMGNLIYHNNFIDNTQQAQDDLIPPPANSWHNGFADGGNYWSDYGGIDLTADGIGDTSYPIPGIASASDIWPWMRADGWKLPYTSFTSVAWDDVNERFWLCGEVSTDAQSCIYYIQNGTFDSMVAIEPPPFTVTALAPDNLGNILLAGNNLDSMFYFDPIAIAAYPVTEIGTGKMWGWNITDITFNPNDNRFYVVGNQMNQDKGVAFHTDTIPLDSGSDNCYLDTSAFISTPPGKLKSIEWNPARDYALVVGDGIYRMDYYDGNPGYELTWSEIDAGSAGITYSDVSWDTDGWNEAAISGDDNTFGSYWRYYHTNPQLQLGFTNGTASTGYSTCAMKPPSSPKWGLILGGSGALQINIEELDQSSTVSTSSINPNLYWVGFNDTAMNPMNNQVINPDSSFYITFEGNYSGGWDQLAMEIDMWYDFGFTGTNSIYPVETEFNRNKAFSLTYIPATSSCSVNYPNGPIMEFQTGSITDIVSIPHPTMPTHSTHRVEIEILLGAQMFAADGSGSMGIGPDYHSDPNIALDRANTWDFNVTMMDVGDPTKFNCTYGEFGVNKAISISITGNPGAEGTPGTNGVYLGSNTIEYSTNTDYWVNVSIPNLYLYGNEASPYFISADKLQVENTNGLSYLPLVSDIDAATYFSGPDLKWCVWGSSAGGALQAPGNGTTAHGPWGSNYNNYGSGDGSTTVEWYVDLPGALVAGTYEATISYSIETEG